MMLNKSPNMVCLAIGLCNKFLLVLVLMSGHCFVLFTRVVKEGGPTLELWGHWSSQHPMVNRDNSQELLVTTPGGRLKAVGRVHSGTGNTVNRRTGGGCLDCSQHWVSVSSRGGLAREGRISSSDKFHGLGVS